MRDARGLFLKKAKMIRARILSGMTREFESVTNPPVSYTLMWNIFSATWISTAKPNAVMARPDK